MPMNDGNPFMDSYGTVCEPPRGEDNPYFRDDVLESYDGDIVTGIEEQDQEEAYLDTETGLLTYD